MSSTAKPSGGLTGAYYGPSIPPSRSHRSVPRSSPCCFCCDPFSFLLCTLFKLIFSILITLGLILLIIYLIFRPHELKVSVQDAKLTSFNLTDSNLNYHLSLNISIRNPNRRISIYYDQIDATAYYDGVRFGYDGSIPVFFQGHKNTTVIYPVFGGQAVALGAVNGTYVREKGEGDFFVDVKVSARIRLKFRFVKVGHFKPKFDCRVKLPVPPAKGGSPATGFERTECDVDWI